MQKYQVQQHGLQKPRSVGAKCRYMQYICYLLLSALVAVSCTGKQGQSGVNTVKEVSADTLSELPLPELPSSLTSPEERAAYLAAHFWDAMDFSNHALSLDTVFMEQNFANYLSVFPAIATQKDMDKAVEALLQKASKDSLATAFLQEVVDKYLQDPNSPMRNEEWLMVFYGQMLKIPAIPEWNKKRIAWRLEVANKNRPGMTGTDFKYVSRKGVNGTMRQYNRTGNTLLVFYDPDCDNCKRILGSLAQMQLPADWRVLAIDAERDRKRWDETKAGMPREWEVGYATTDILGQQLYDLPAYPVIYLLDSKKRVILKDPPLEQLMEYIRFK